MNLQNRNFAVKLKFLVNCFIKVCCIIQKIDILTMFADTKDDKKGKYIVERFTFNCENKINKFHILSMNCQNKFLEIL